MLATDYRARVLPADEWGRLAHTELGPVAALLPRDRAQVIVVEDDAGAIVGCWGLVWALHAEGVWIDPAHRGRAGIARRLLDATLDAASAQGARTIVTGALTPGVERLLTRHLGATRLPGSHFVFGVGG